MVADLPQEIPIFCDFTHSQNCKLDDAPSSKNAQAVVMAFEKLADDLYARCFGGGGGGGDEVRVCCPRHIIMQLRPPVSP